MKISSVAVLLASALVTGASAIVPLPVQTYFIPLKEDVILTETFQGIAPSEAEGPIQSYTSIAIGVNNTIIWFDHHEDGYESDPTNPTSMTTQIWGDGDTSNGVAPGHTDDILLAGEVIVLHSLVDVPRDSSILFDGGDKIMSSFGIAVTRGAFPFMQSGSSGDKGSMLAGAVEVLDTASWGTYFEAPIGEDSINNPRFEQTQLYVMAGELGASITIESTSGTKTHTLGPGESVQERVNMGATVTSDYDVQVDLLAGDIGSTYEMRWFSLLPVADWSTKYLSSVGNSKANVVAYVYNPLSGPSNLAVDYTEHMTSTQTLSVPPGEIKVTQHLDTDHGTLFEASAPFVVFTIIDTVSSGQIYDWGAPVAPFDSLTAQVLVGWGDGCTNDNCGGHTDQQRSEVWISPVADATCTVDFNSDGIDDEFEVKDGEGISATRTMVNSVNLLQHEATTLWDHNDQDMTGAMVKCSNSQGPVPFAAVWGQNPDQSKSGDDYALDMGTLIPPYPCLLTVKIACLTNDINGNGEIDADDTCEITTRTVDNCLGTQSDSVSTGFCGDTSEFLNVEICLPTTSTTTVAPPAATTTSTTTVAPPAATTTSATNPSFGKEGGGGGDPHFQRWGRERDTFHGECDLVMIHSDSFHNGDGFDFHVRTTIQDYFSFIETAALRLGDWTIQFFKDTVYVNGAALSPNELPFTFGDDFKYTISNEVIPSNQNAKYYQYYGVKLNEDSKMLIKFYKQYLTFTVVGHSNDFLDSVGMLGHYETGLMYSRDGAFMENFQENAFEWQVNPEDPKLFLDSRGPQLPFEQCRMPTASRPARRKLRGADEAFLKAAQEACAHIKGSDFELCTDDVMTTGDLGIADLW